MYMRKKAAGVPLGFIEPCLPSSAIRVPSGSHWVYEITTGTG